MADGNLQGKRKKRQAHVLALPFPFQGHINPLLELSLKLAAEDIAISFINTPHYHAHIVPSLQPLLNRSHLPLRFLSLSDAYPPPPDLRLQGSMELCLRHICSGMLEEVENVILSLLEQNANSLPFTCLLADVRIPFARCLAEKFGIARIAFWTQSAASFAYHTALARGFRLPADELAIVDCIPGVPTHTMCEAPVIFRRDLVGDFIFDFIMKPFLQLDGALAVVINTFESLEAEAMDALRGNGLNVLSIGPLLPLAYSRYSASTSPELKKENRREGEHFCLKWLDALKPASVVYISFGTLVCLEEASFEELAFGIEASGRNFLWSLRPNMVAGNRSHVFIEAFMKRTELRGLVVPWVPQVEVLSHAAIGGFLTHCGWNSSLESMCRGVPMIGLPVFGEQKLNLMCLVQCWKVCLSMKEEGIRRDKVEESVKALVEGVMAEELQSTAKKVQEKAACAMVSNGSSSANFKLVLKLVLENEKY